MGLFPLKNLSVLCYSNNPGGLRGKMNPYTGRSFSDRYFDILRKRIELPVWEYRENFFSTFKEHKVFVLVGETGSGKTTQVSQWDLCAQLVLQF